MYIKTECNDFQISYNNIKVRKYTFLRKVKINLNLQYMSKKLGGVAQEAVVKEIAMGKLG